MDDSKRQDVTQLLHASRRGDRDALQALMVAVVIIAL